MDYILKLPSLNVVLCIHLDKKTKRGIKLERRMQKVCLQQSWESHSRLVVWQVQNRYLRATRALMWQQQQTPGRQPHCSPYRLGWDPTRADATPLAILLRGDESIPLCPPALEIPEDRKHPSLSHSGLEGLLAKQLHLPSGMSLM